MIISKETQDFAIHEMNNLSFKEYNFVSHNSTEISDKTLSRSFTKVSGGDKDFIEKEVLKICEQHFSDDILSFYRIEIKAMFDFKFKVILKPKLF